MHRIAGPLPDHHLLKSFLLLRIRFLCGLEHCTSSGKDSPFCCVRPMAAAEAAAFCMLTESSLCSLDCWTLAGNDSMTESAGRAAKPEDPGIMLECLRGRRSKGCSFSLRSSSSSWSLLSARILASLSSILLDSFACCPCIPKGPSCTTPTPAFGTLLSSTIACPWPVLKANKKVL